MDYQRAIESEGQRRAEAHLHNLFTLTRQKAVEVWEQAKSMVIVDYDVVVDDMHFSAQAAPGAAPLYDVVIGGDRKDWEINHHALKQMAAEVSIPATFVNTLVNADGAWEREELAFLLNERFAKSEFKQRSFLSRASFINRVVGNEVRGFVSPSFKIWLSTPHMLEAFARACAQFQAMPVEAHSGALQFTFRSVLPFVFEPKAGTYVALGCSFSNSDFGAGALRVKLDVMNISNGVLSCVKPIMTKSHGGGARRDQEEQSSSIKPETMQKLVVGAQAEVADAVEAALHPKNINGLLETITKAMEKDISWARLQNYLSGKLTQDEIRHLELLIKGEKQSKTLPSLRYDSTLQTNIIDLWWAANAVGEIADSVMDEGRRSELRDTAGGLLAK